MYTNAVLICLEFILQSYLVVKLSSLCIFTLYTVSQSIYFYFTDVEKPHLDSILDSFRHRSSANGSTPLKLRGKQLRAVAPDWLRALPAEEHVVSGCCCCCCSVCLLGNQVQVPESAASNRLVETYMLA